MEDYKLLIVFADIDDNVIIRALTDIERIVLFNDSHSTVSGVSELKSKVWELSFRSTKKVVRTLLYELSKNPNIERNYIATRV